MFRVSQEIRLNANRNSFIMGHSSSSDTDGGTRNDSGNACIFGKYQRTPDTDCYPTEEHRIFVAPELTDASKLQLLHFPKSAVRLNTDAQFIIKRNGVKGNIEVRLESPSGISKHVPLQKLDPERLQATCQQLNQPGLYQVHIKCNAVPLPRSPFIIITIGGTEAVPDASETPKGGL